MARSSIRDNANQVTTDNGSTTFSVIQGEQQKFRITLKWFTNIASTVIRFRVIEGNNSNGAIPNAVKTGVSSQLFPIHGTDGTAFSNGAVPSTYTGNSFDVIFPDDFANTANPAPVPGDTGDIYYFYDLEVLDTGSGDNQQIYVPLRGLIQVRYKVPAPAGGAGGQDGGD